MMEIGGTLKDYFTKYSDHDSKALCQPCSNDGEHRIAQGYCKTCDEFLCTKCYKGHTLPSICRNHVMLDKSQMPTKSPRASRPARPSPCTIPCTDHPEKMIEFYCQVHKTVLCGVCSVLYHNKPCELKYILDMKNILKYKDSANYQDIVRRLETMEQDINASITDISENEALTEEQINALIEEFRAFRQEVEKYFKKREEELTKLARKMKQEDKTALEELTKGLQTMKAEVEESQTKLTSLENGTSDLFVISNQIEQRLTDLEREFRDTMTHYRLPEYRFTRDETVQQLVSINVELGKLERTYRTKQVKQSPSKPPVQALSQDFRAATPERLPRTKQVKKTPSKPSTQVLIQDFRGATAKRLPNIDVKTTGDSKNPWITGLLLVQPHTLLMVDRHNNKVKALDVRTNQVTSELKLTSDPWDLTSLNGDQEAAVTLPEKKQIQVISATGSLSSLRSINVQGKCSGITSTSQMIVVSFCSPAKVQVINLNGKVLTNIQTDASGQLFSGPYYLTCTMEELGEMIYVTDRGTNIISKFTMDGQLISTYRHGQWRGLEGVIAVGNNQLLVCDLGRYKVDVVSEGGEVITLLNKGKHGIEEPDSLCYCEPEGKLYVGAGSVGKNPLSVYKLSHK